VLWRLYVTQALTCKKIFLRPYLGKCEFVLFKNKHRSLFVVLGMERSLVLAGDLGA
jgi:hypothetical protein